MNTIAALRALNAKCIDDCSKHNVELSAARPGGREWKAWVPAALASPDAAVYRKCYAEGGLKGAALESRVLDRMSSFCETCMRSHVPDRDHVVWFDAKYEGYHPAWGCGRRRGSCRSACRECLCHIPETQRPRVAWTS